MLITLELSPKDRLSLLSPQLSGSSTFSGLSAEMFIIALLLADYVKLLSFNYKGDIMLSLEPDGDNEF